MIKRVLLIVFDYNRRDFLDLFRSFKDEFHFYFIEYASPRMINTNYYKEFGKALYWKDYNDAFELLNQIKPDKVIFFFIEAYNHVALNVACKSKNIKTVHLEHGFRDYALKSLVVQNKVYKRATYMQKVLKVMPQLFSKIQNRKFFLNTLKKVGKNERRFLKYYYQVRSKNNIYTTFQMIDSHYRIADEYVSFSPEIFKAHQQADHLPKHYPVFYTGFPAFDQWANLSFKTASNFEIIFIDQPFVNRNILGWTASLKLRFISDLVNVCSSIGYILNVKLHPLDDTTIWDSFIDGQKVNKILDDEFFSYVQRNRIIMGFYSTLLMPLAALKHTVLFTFVNHPVKDVFPSKFLVEEGVAEPIYNMTELESRLTNVENIYHHQMYSKKGFIEKWMYKFDGKASERLFDLLKN